MFVRWIGLIVALAAAGALAQPDTHVPSELEDWREWVLHGQEYRRCPFRFNSSASSEAEFICAWPGQLELTVSSAGGEFAQDWTVYGRPQWLPLPGDAEVWPQAVSVNGRDAQVVVQDALPAIELGVGRHRVVGAFAWDERPATLAVPAASGALALTVDGIPVPRPRRGDGSVWLAEGEREEQVQDALVVDVYRRVVDDIPTRLDTVFNLQISGGVRDERLSPALPAGFVPLRMTSELPAQVLADGSLRLQARPGDWRIVLTARAGTVVDSVALSVPESNMPDEEIWSYQAVPRLRATLPEAARPVDPTQVGAEWSELPTFRIGAGESLAVVERSRGQADVRNEISLHRRLWLDFDGGGFVFADRLGGTMRTGWRLDMAAPYALLGATEHGDDLLVTTHDGLPGVEVRGAELDVEALGRIGTRGEMPVAGWQTDVQSAAATLNLPPGHKLLAAFGVDAADASWTGRWRLLDFFLLLIVAVAAARLFGRAAGVVALVALTLSFHEPGAPVWTWLNLLAAVALARVAPPGRLQRVARSYRLGSMAVLLVFLVPFVIGQIRIAVYPQLEPESHRTAQTVGLFEMLSGRMTVRPPPPLAEPILRALQADGVQEMVVTGAALPFARYADGALVQTGPGRPDWQWTPYRLSWSGPVDAERTMRLAIMPDWLVSVLRFVTVAAIVAFAALFAFDIAGRVLPDWRRWRAVFRRSAGALGATVLAVVLLDGFNTVEAATPAPEILDELERRLTAPPSCAPRCAELVDARVSVAEAALSIRLEIHAAQAVAVPLPGSAAGWYPTLVTRGADGQSDVLPTIRDDEGVLWAHVSAGRHVLSVQGPLPPGDTLEIPFAIPPRTIAAQSEHWLVGGIEDRVLTAGSLNLTRLRVATDGEEATWEANRLPTFVRIERYLSLRLDWDVYTVVGRIAPAIGAVNIVVPLIEGASVVSGHSLTEAGIAVAMEPAEQEFVWRSTLPRTTSLTLRAAADQPWQEVWRVDVGHMWKVNFDGVPQSSAGGPTGRGIEFHPRPGETLALSIERPQAIGGDTLAFDNVALRTDVGAHLRHTELAANYRSTRGNSHGFGLPPGAELQAVMVDGETQPLVLADGRLNLPILPGEHEVSVRWQQSEEPGFRVAAPTVDLGAPASNIVTSLEMPASRWLLFATGPTLGPAMLYWSELIALVAIALLLGRFRVTPLRWWHWLLLGVGFSSFSWVALAIVAFWLLAHGTREAWGGGLSRLVYNLSQIGFAVLTLAAFAAILAGIPSGLLGSPDMHIAGFESEGHRLTWFADQTGNATPEAAVWSLPMWTYKGLILAWALWLSFILVRWLPWVWRCFAARGLWLAKPVEEAAA